MKYNLADPKDVVAARSRITYLVKKQAIIEVKEQRRGRSLAQNSYLHLLLGLFALETGYKLEEAKVIYKRHNKDIYVYRRGKEAFLKSSADLSVEDMTLSIDRFRHFAAEQGIDLPAAMTPEEMMSLENLMEKNRRYL